MTKPLTKCCSAAYGVGGKGTTHWYLCTTCGQPTHPPEADPLSDEESEALLLRSEHGIAAN